jgi:serine phosphatase RsbU (regulator of sigma subunit)/CHASE2 domain-containing sensor protein
MRRLIRLLFGSWARRAGWATLLLVLLAQIFAGWVFEVPRFALFDFYARIAPRLKHGNPVVIVAVDDASLKAIGQWPWPRQTEARLLSMILSAHPAALGLDMIYSEPDRLSPEQWLRGAGSMPMQLSQALRRLPNHDQVLADVLRAGPVVVGIGGLHDASKPDRGPLTPFRVIRARADATASASLPRFDAALRSISVLDAAAPGHGVLSVDPDPDGVFRRMPLIFSLSGRIAPSLGLELLRLVAKKSWFDLRINGAGIEAVEIGALRIPTQSDGSVWVNFSPHDPRRFVTAADVLAGHVSPDRFAQRIIIFVATATGTNDWHQTPVGAMPGAEIHAQILENILDGKLAKRPDFALVTEILMTFVLALLQIISLPPLRLRWQVTVALAELTGLGALGIMVWSRWLLLIDVATPAIGQVLVFAALLGGNFAEADAQRRQLRRDLEQTKLAAAKAEGELEAGRKIQLGMLPFVASVADNRVELGPLMIPAREVGGDLYDFFKIGEDRLFFAIADVSGKGVPAALFMALGKAVCQSCALRGEGDIAAIINRANPEISRNNRESMFITMFAGILDLSTGEFQFCNSGHEAPFLLRAGSAPLSLATRGGPPLCIDQDYGYEAEYYQLERGDMLCLMTDGVAEAMNSDGAMMGRDRVKIALGQTGCDARADAVTDRLRAAVDNFANGAEAADDLTILTIRWCGRD